MYIYLRLGSQSSDQIHIRMGRDEEFPFMYAHPDCLRSTLLNVTILAVKKAVRQTYYSPLSSSEINLTRLLYVSVSLYAFMQ